MGMIGLEMVGEFMDVDITAREKGISEVARGAQETYLESRRIKRNSQRCRRKTR